MEDDHAVPEEPLADGSNLAAEEAAAPAVTAEEPAAEPAAEEETEQPVAEGAGAASSPAAVVEQSVIEEDQPAEAEPEQHVAAEDFAPGDEAAQSAALGDDELPSLEDLEKSPFGLAAFTNVTATPEMHV